MPNIENIPDIEFSELYDQENDVYYVTFNTGEPSYVVEEDDILLTELGIFTHHPTGFRILNFSKYQLQVKLLQRVLRKSFRKIFERAYKSSKTKDDLAAIENQVNQFLEKVSA